MMTLNELKSEISHLDLSERLLLVEEIWDGISTTHHSLPVSDAHKQQLDERYRDFQAGRVELHDYQAVHAELRARYK